jgi:hypothetical protein
MSGKSTFCFLAGAAFLSGAILSFRRRSQAISSWHKTDGTVIEIKDKYESNADLDDISRHYYSPVVRFQANDGKTHIFHDESWTRPSQFKVGDRVRVAYDPINPASAQVLSWSTYVLELFAAGVALFFFLVSFAV